MELGSICNNDYVCDLNMECRNNLNEFDSRCKCLAGYTSIISTKTGYFECGMYSKKKILRFKSKYL